MGATEYSKKSEKKDKTESIIVKDKEGKARLDVNGAIRMGDDSSSPTASNVGTQRYRVSGNNSYVDMVMQTGAATYAWVNIVQNNW